MEQAQRVEVTSSGTSALDDGLGVSLPPDCKFYFSNDELAAAISYAFQCCDQKYVGGYNTSHTEPGKVMLEHLKALLTAQKIRAGMIETPNVQVQGAAHDLSRSSPGTTGWGLPYHQR